MTALLTRIEVDVMQAGEIADAVELAVKYKLPALVVHPALTSQAFVARGARQGKFKIITPIDWPKGDVFGQSKLRGLTADALDAEGFEFLLTGGMSTVETRTEAKALTKFVRDHLSPVVEIRFVLGTMMRDDDNIARMCEAMTDVPTPSYIRNCIHLKTQVSKANSEVHNATMDTILSHFSAPLKICGNIGGVRAMAATQRAVRYGTSLVQARDIINEIQKQPTELKEILDAAPV